jgi:hypothetical protein
VGLAEMVFVDMVRSNGLLPENWSSRNGSLWVE